MSDKENDLIREDTVTEPEADAAAAADNAEGAERDAAPSEPETAKSGKKSNKPREKFSVWFKRNRKKILLSLTAILSLGAVLAVILVPTHFATLNEPGDFIDLPVARLSPRWKNRAATSRTPIPSGWTTAPNRARSSSCTLSGTARDRSRCA